MYYYISRYSVACGRAELGKRRMLCRKGININRFIMLNNVLHIKIKTVNSYLSILVFNLSGFFKRN